MFGPCPDDRLRPITGVERDADGRRQHIYGSELDFHTNTHLRLFADIHTRTNSNIDTNIDTNDNGGSDTISNAQTGRNYSARRLFDLGPVSAANHQRPGRAHKERAT